MIQTETTDPKLNYLKNEIQNLQQSMTFYCVPIPGETEWVKEVIFLLNERNYLFKINN